jgi:hypothetical protein
VAWSVERALDADVQQFCAGKYNPYRDIINNKTAPIHTHRIADFFSAIHDDNISASEEGLALATDVLASFEAALQCRSTVVEFMRKLPLNSHRRPKLRKGLLKHKKRALLFMAQPDKIKELEKQISDFTKERMIELKQDRNVARTEQNHIQQGLESWNNGAASGYEDVSAAPQGSAYLDSAAIEAHNNAYQNLLRCQQNDSAHAREARKAMIVEVYTTIDYIPLADFK